MDNQHQLIKGYRDLSPQEIALMNEATDLAEKCGEFVGRLRQQPSPILGDAEAGPALDLRWVSIGATHLQQGFMAITRGIARPTTF